MLKIDNDGELIHTYSDAGFKIRRNDEEIFEEAYDLKNSGYSYKETDEKSRIIWKRIRRIIRGIMRRRNC